jgi:hypothetical protein
VAAQRGDNGNPSGGSDSGDIAFSSNSNVNGDVEQTMPLVGGWGPGHGGVQGLMDDVSMDNELGTGAYGLLVSLQVNLAHPK